MVQYACCRVQGVGFRVRSGFSLGEGVGYRVYVVAGRELAFVSETTFTPTKLAN
jgi:hypothetical protein